MMNSPSVLVVGSLMQDLTFACATFPRAGETIVGKLRSGQGGKGSNQAIACGRTGVRTAFVGAVGEDSFAVKVENFYRQQRILCHLARKPKASTGTAVILLDAAGQNQIVIEPGANASLAPRDVPASWLSDAKVVVTQLESNLATTAQVLRRARRNGAITVLNPAPMRSEFDASLLQCVDVLIPNESEFASLVRLLPGMEQPDFSPAQLAKLDDDAMHQLCRRMDVATVIVTLGVKGCLVSTEQGWTKVPAHSVRNVVDTTGAGDAFCGGFAAGLVRTGNLVEAARFGTAVAALSITRPGAADAMPTKQEIERFLRRAVLA